MLKKLQQDVVNLKANSNSSSGNNEGNNSNLFIEINGRLDKIEARLDALDKKIGGLSRANAGAGNSNSSGDLIVIETRLGDIENRFNAHLIDYEKFKNDVFNALKNL